MKFSCKSIGLVVAVAAALGIRIPLHAGDGTPKGSSEDEVLGMADKIESEAGEQGEPGQGHEGHPGKLRQRILKEFDQDGDGHLNREECAAAKHHLHQHAQGRKRDAHSKEGKQERLERFDKDGDGQISEEEKQAAHAEMESRKAGEFKKHLERFDKDGDGQISEEEKQAAHAEMEKKKAEHPGLAEKRKKGMDEHRKKHKDHKDNHEQDSLQPDQD